MSKINEEKVSNNIFYKVYLTGFFLILALPLLVFPPYFLPPDWGKTIIFRSILAILLFLFTFQLLYKKNEFKLPDIKKNKIVWVLAIFSLIIILATLFSQDIGFSLWGSPYRAEGAVDFLFYIIFAVFSFLIIKPADWNKALTASIFVGILVCFIAFIQFYGLFNNIFFSVPDRPASTMGNPIMLGIYLLVLFFIVLSFCIKEKKVIYKTFYIFSLLLFFLTILITGSRASYLGLIFGAIYFSLFYPGKSKKIAIFKISFAVILILGLFTVYYVNSQRSSPQFLADNKIFQAVKNRLSIETALEDPRFSAWQVVIKAIKEKPIFGWGPENLAIGFDKHYDPSLPYISKAWGGWWDRAHNIILDTAATSGVPTAIIYLTLFAVLFWQLQKSKSNQQQITKIGENPIVYHGIQATLIAYLVANFFSFDGFSTYLLFYLIIGYSLHLTHLSNDEILDKNNLKRTKGVNLITAILFILLVFFLWQYNIVPLRINSQIVRADNFADDKKCEQSFLVINKVLAKRSFLDAYMAMHYVEAIKKCAGESPTKDLEYAKKGVELMKEAIKIRPLYSRLWIFLGSFTTIKANAEQDPTEKESLIKEATTYFEKANQLAPNHQEILVEWAKTDMVAGDYQSMKEKSLKCITLDQSLGDCYWIKALSEIYLKDIEQAKEDIKIANDKRFDTTSALSLHQLVNAYAITGDYKDLVATYIQLIKLNPNVPEYHSSLAFTYSQMGEYKKAREEAMIFLQLMPEAKDEVNAFLKTLPY